jgi:hypothetical protein
VSSTANTFDTKYVPSSLLDAYSPPTIISFVAPVDPPRRAQAVRKAIAVVRAKSITIVFIFFFAERSQIWGGEAVPSICWLASSVGILPCYQGRLSIQFRTLRCRQVTCPKSDFPAIDNDVPPGDNVAFLVLRHNDQVCVRDAETMHNETNTLRAKMLPQGLREPLRKLDDVTRQVIWQIAELVNMPLRDDQKLSGTGRVECHEGHHLVVMVDHARRGLSGHYLAEYAVAILVHVRSANVAGVPAARQRR